MFVDEFQSKINSIVPDSAEELISLFDLKRLGMFYNFLTINNELGGFFSKGDEPKILERHFVEPIIHIFKIVKSCEINPKKKIADVGSGPGIPGYFFSCLKIQPKITLIDSQARRLKLLQKFHEENFTEEIDFIYLRVEEIKSKKFDFVLMRSTIPYPWSMEMITNILVKKGCFIPFLAKNIYNFEVEESLFKNIGFQLKEEILLSELNFIGERRLKFLVKISEPKFGFPRTWDKIVKDIKRFNG